MRRRKAPKEEAPAAAKELDKAGDHSRKDAEKKLAFGEKARLEQKNAAGAYRDADQQIDKAMKGPTAQQQLDQEEEGKGEQIAKAADKSAKVDPDALAALREAEKNAKTRDGERAPPSDPQEARKRRRV